MTSLKSTYKLQIPIGELFNFLGMNNDFYDTIQIPDREIKINTPTGMQPINAFIKKRGIVNTFTFANGASIKCDNKHLVKQSDGSFRFIKSVNHIIDANNNTIPLVSKTTDDQTVDVFDISMDHPHEYLTSSGIVCHNTSCCKLIANALDADVLYINASSENSIDTVREKITSFATTIGFSKWKIVILDEFSLFSFSGMSALNGLMESTSKHTRFFFTGNYIEKFLPSIISRCSPFLIQSPPIKLVCRNIANILTAENVKFDPKTVVRVVEQFYPDQRAMLNYCQTNSITGELIYSELNAISSDYCSKIVDTIKNSSDPKTTFTSIRQIIADSKVRQFDELFKYLYDNLDEFVPTGKKAQTILHIADCQHKILNVVDGEIQIAAMFINILRDLK